MKVMKVSEGYSEGLMKVKTRMDVEYEGYEGFFSLSVYRESLLKII